jgi:VWFA-related protein
MREEVKDMSRHNSRRITLTLLTLSALLFSFGLLAQDRPAGEFGSDVEVNEVLLDVLVTDRDGNVVVGLGPDDFVVEEDGETVPVTGVTFYSNSRFVESAGDAQAKGIRVDRVPVDRYFILFFDDQRRGAPRAVQAERQQMEAGRDARQWVRDHLLPTDWVAVVSYDTRLKVHQDFTRDKSAVLAALEDAPLARNPKGNWPSRQEAGDDPSLTAYLPTGKELGKESRTIYDGLELVADAAGHVIGRKNLVLFSRGFGDVNRFGIYQPDPRYYPDMERALNDNNVAVYTVDLTPNEVEHTLSDALNQLAAETGGRYYENFISFETPLQRIAEENSGYYLLSYESRRPAGKSGFQAVDVETTNRQFKVAARKGYAYGEAR